MSFPRPTGYPKWCASGGGATNLAQPDGAHQNVGWAVNEPPASSFFNYLQQQYYNWIQYLDDDLQNRAKPLLFQEDWVAAPPVFLSGLTAYSQQLAFAPRWYAVATGAASKAFGQRPDQNFNKPRFFVQSGNLNQPYAFTTMLPVVATGLSGARSYAMEAVVMPESRVADGSEYHFGFLAAGTSDFRGPTGVAGFARFRKPAGATGWVAEVGQTGGTAISSVAVGQFTGATGGGQLCRVEVGTPDNGSSGTSKFFVNGSLVATGPAFNAGAFAHFAMNWVGSGSTSVGGMAVGPLSVFVQP